MYKQEFKKIVESAVNNSQKIRENKIANPFYIGFGNPNSDIIIFGKEQAFKETNQEQLFLESSNNPNEWADYIKGNYQMQKHEIKHINENYINCFYPYSFKMKAGHTWSKYQKLINYISEKDNFYFNEFLFDSFIYTRAMSNL